MCTWYWYDLSFFHFQVNVESSSIEIQFCMNEKQKNVQKKPPLTQHQNVGFF